MHRKAFLLPALALAVAACDDPTASGTARLTVQLTDAPADYIESAVVDIGEIVIFPADGPGIPVVADAGTYDLLTLQNGVTADLGTITLDPGVYTELRMIVESAEVTLKDPYLFTSGEATQQIKVPSGPQSGIKISLQSAGGSPGEGVQITPGETVLVVDFPVGQNFVMQGDAETPAGIHGYNFTPRLHAVVRDVAASMAGQVTGPDGVSVEGLTVTATRTDVMGFEAMGLTDATGNYFIPFMQPGEYDVTVSDPPAGHVSSTASPTLGENEDLTGVDLELTAAP